MAEVTLNQLLDVVRGGVGKLVIRRRPDGKLILSGAPSYGKGKGTAKQKAHRERMRQAAHYAKWADRCYPIYAELAKKSDKWLSPYNVALSDWFEAPVIHHIEHKDGSIRVQASDNVTVAKVRVSILDGEGKVLEQGEATRAEGDWWVFACTVQGAKIVAVAYDLPDNRTRFELQVE